MQKFQENNEIFEANLRQNLELWEELMKSIDNIQYSDESYDYDYVRKSSKDFIQSHESSDSKASFRIYDPIINNESKKTNIYSNIPNTNPRYARTLDAYFSVLMRKKF